MNKNEKFVITINRELGSGGRTIGEKLAERLGVPYYDKAVIKALKEEYHLTTSEIEQLKGRKHDWWSEFKRNLSAGLFTARSQYYQIPMDDEPDLLTTDEIFETEKDIIKGIADAESCVIAGRSGFFVLRDHPNHVNILIQAPLDKRISRITVKQGMTYEEAEKTIKKIDKMRENYVQKYTGTSRYDTRNYDLVISVNEMTEDDAVDVIMKYLKLD
jgi:cytidylate kinase